VTDPVEAAELAPQLGAAERLSAAARKHAATVGVAISGSLAAGRGDRYSDLDLVVVARDAAGVGLLRDAIPAADGVPVARYGGEHVGEPRLVVALYGSLVKVDFMFLRLDELAEWNGGRPIRVLWESSRALTRALGQPVAATTPREAIEDVERRFWTWSWYALTKVCRGERYEGLSAIGYLRDRALLPMLALGRGRAPRGPRRIDELVESSSLPFEQTLAGLDQGDLLRALRATIALYRRIADPLLARHGIAPAAAARELVSGAVEQELALASERAAA